MLQEQEIVVEDVAAEAVPLNSDVESIMESLMDPLNSGFKWYIPPLATATEHSTGGHMWTVSGHDMQVLTTTVPPGEEVITEVGSFMFMAPFMTTQVELTLCSSSGCFGGWSRVCGGESCVKVHLKNDSSEEGYVGITPNYPAKVLPIKFGTHLAPGQAFIAQGGSAMSQLGDVNVGCDLDCGLSTCCCAGLGCCRQKVSGADGSIVFLAAGGTIMYRDLEPSETIMVNSQAVLAFEQSVILGITPNGRCGVVCCGGDGCCATTLT